MLWPVLIPSLLESQSSEYIDACSKWMGKHKPQLETQGGIVSVHILFTYIYIYIVHANHGDLHPENVLLGTLGDDRLRYNVLFYISNV